MNSGIYIIENTYNGKFYIGSSKNIHRRIVSHFGALRSKRHVNSYLQRAWNKYSDYFTWRVIEYCELTDLRRRELYFIDTLSPHYNLVRVANQTFKMSNESRLRMSLAAKGRKKSSAAIKASAEGMRRMQSLLTKEERFENTIPLRDGFYRKLPEIRLKISKALKGRVITKESKLKGRAAKGMTQLGLYDSHGNRIKIFDFITEVAQFLECNKDSVKKAIDNNRPLLRGKYIIRRSSALPEILNTFDRPVLSNCHFKPVMICKEGVVLKICKSIKEAAEITNSNYVSVCRWLSGVKCRKGLTFKFIENL